ncbi:aldo/keto reductase [Occallatibacter riparius]|uniref:Aldo/keto reductase n=1 Tax=Occallatibacter riparius TaxID=1002689 RepID=A0A9J7BNW2_9BACT|nr:aldo/keto reductase [Occallatibacter riparius]UWZ84209.1 aldo/keto reductase [Occallatibacter riparius]
MAGSGAIPTRPFGKTGVKVSALGLGGHHLGAAKDEQTAVEIVHRALDGGITFFDCCWEYNRGKSEGWLGKGLKGARDKAFLMTKVCTHGRDASLAMQMLEQSLRRLQTDHLDLWQIHGVSFPNDPDLFIRPGGAAEALEKAKKDGKVRFTGFTGHKDPDIHLAMLKTGFAFDAVQMPLNPFDANFHSFEQKVLPVLNQRGIAPIGMKPIGGHGEPVQKGVFTAQELLGYAMSLPVAVTLSGVSEPEILEQNLKVAQGFTPLSQEEMQKLRERAKPYAGDGQFELYKVSIKFDNPEARIAHEFPLDPKQVEVQQMIHSTQNTGRPYPQVTDSPGA